MSRRSLTRKARDVALTLGALLPLAATPAAAQSILSAGGLGYPLDAVDARSRALGGVGLGLFGPSVLPTDPASAADLRIPAIGFTFHTSWIEADGAAAADARGTRFPLLGFAYPVGQEGMATLTFSGVLDQRWQVQDSLLVDLGDELARVTDTFVSDGGVSAVRLGYARRISPSLAVGFAAGSHLGRVTRTYTRRFDSLGVETNVAPYSVDGRWSYTGPTATVGAQTDVGDVFRAAASVTWSGTLTADPSDETPGGELEFDLPMQYRLGASGSLAPGLNLVAGVSWAAWSEDALGAGDASSPSGALDVGAGLEFGQARLLGWQAPLRLGWRRTDLPFSLSGDDVVESAFTGGVGLNLAQAEDLPLARLDLAAERGSRDAGAFSESFWRASLSLRVAGF